LIAKTTAERQRELRARRTAEARANRAAGLVLVELWAHPDDATALRAHATKLAAKRAKKEQK